MLIGYVRVSTAEQNAARQEVLMQELGAEKVFVDKASGKNVNRPQLNEMLAFARQGDTIVVESISRFARNTKDLLELMEKLTAKGVGFISKKEAIDTGTPTGKFIHKDGAGNAGYFVPFPGLSTTAHMYGRDSSTALYTEYFRMELTQNENLRPDTGRTDNGKGL